MKITYSKFHITHRKKFYQVEYEVQSINTNTSFVNVTVKDSSNSVLLYESLCGRQIVSSWNAKNSLRKALIENGLMKDRKKQSV
jgi:hypothetical protein